MTHTPTVTAGVYRCPACGFHAIATQQGIRVIDSGAGRQLHLAAIAQQQVELRAYVEQMLRRLVRQYNERRPIFWELYRLAWPEGYEIEMANLGGERDDGALSMRQVRELSRHIRAEYLL